MYKNYFNSGKPPYPFNLNTKFTIRKKPHPFIWLLLLFFSVSAFSQSLGDYRSVSPGGAWTSVSSWQYYNGSAWVAATTYPGQNPTGNVTIQSGHSITIGTDGLNTDTISSIIISGNLTLTGTNTGGDGTDYFFNTPLLSVTPLLGTITFINKVDLLLPNNSVLLVTTDTTPNPDYFGLIGDCNHNQDIHIGTSVYAYCNGGGNTALTFFQVMNNGGSLNAIASASAPNCEGNSINLQGNYSGTVGTAITYNWSIVAPGGGTSTSTLQNPIISNALPGTYTATLTCTTTHNSNNYSNNEMVSIVVSPRPGTITIGAVTQPTCALPTGSITLNNLPAGNWILNPGAISGSGSSYTVSGLAPGSYSFTATSANGCVSNPSSSVTLTSPNKVWNGSTSSNWFTAANWTPNGVPSATDCVTIANSGTPPIISGATTALAYSITVLSGGNLTLTSASVLEVTHNVNVAPTGSFTIENSGSLVQINGVSNTGNITLRRQANIKALDYVYWSSPVANFNLSNVSTGTTGYKYKWTPTIPTNTNGFGNWVGANEIMALGKGYIVRGPDSYTTTLAPFNAVFTGTPNNGTITTPISRGTWNGGNYATRVSTTQGTNHDDNWNLVGNPYPSAVDAIDFLTLNTNIDGFINVWTHGTLPTSAIADPFYNNYTYNYTPGDYITYNSSGASAGPGTFGGYIGAGQGFFVLMNHTSASETETVTFNNTMRSSTYDNQQFFRTTDDNNNGRVWLDLIASNGSNVRNLVAYVDGATNNRDRMFDAITDEKLSLNLYSAIGDEFMKIQGRTLPFDQEDRVPMGIKVPQNGNYTIGIAAVDGFFTNDQNIYLEDKENNTIHDLRLNPYSFTANAGNYPNRFVLRYTNETLGGDDLVADEANLWVISSDGLAVKSTKNEIQSVRVFDVLGRELAYYPNVDGYEVPLNTIQKNNAGLIIQVTLSNGTVVSKKTIY